MKKPLIAVTGKNGQLGSELNDLAASSNSFDFVFAGRDELDLADLSSIESFFKKYKPDYFINCAAYTAVDKAEQDQENAYKINAEAVGKIAYLCRQNYAVLIHVSTDYVFNGKNEHPYKTDDKTEPVNYYGYTKWLGEKLALENCNNTIIIRTSWVYSSYGNNFVKTMLRLMKDRTDLNVVNDQLGSPTYAKDLAEAILQIILQIHQTDKIESGIYHFSNEGIISWYEFATAIRNNAALQCNVHPIKTEQYPTPAKRPAYSVMSKEKITSVYNIQIKDWESSLHECLQQLL
ncbi:MAG: dTDP-4-dehydrorhamnose reductase [Ilyomonas sp.]